MLSLFAKIKIVFINLYLSGIFTLIVYLLFQRSKDIAKANTIAIVLLIFIMFLNYKLCSSIACPVPLTKKELVRGREKLIEEYKEKSEELFKSAGLFYPDKETVKEDEYKIVQGIRKLLNFNRQSSELSRIKDSISIIQINKLFGMNYSTPDNSAFTTISDSLEIKFLCYSSDYKHLIAILTYKKDYSHFDLDFYNGLVLF